MTENKEESKDPLKKPEQVEPFEISDVVKEHFDDYSLDVLESFGMDAPAKLNDYACALEDALIEQVGKIQVLSQYIENLEKRGLKVIKGSINKN